MQIAVSVTLALLFVFLAGFNVWNMLSRRGNTPRSNRLWTQVHRAAGYLFIALFAIFCYCMLLRIRGWARELPPRLIVHMGFALLLLPLLLVKVMVARYQKAARGLLTALGIAILTSSFILVAMNVSIHFLRVTSTVGPPIRTTVIFIVVVLLSAAVAFAATGKQSKMTADTRPAATVAPAELPSRKRGEPLQMTLARIEAQTHDAKTLRFLLPRGEGITPRPGQFMTFEWVIDGKPVTRSYSICSSPVQIGYVEITPKRVENGCVSQFLNDRATVGLRVKARGPYGKFHFDENQHDRIVLIAAGSGITPMIAMLRYIDDLCIPVSATLIYCVRTQQDVFFKKEFAALEGRLSNFRYVLVLSRPNSGWTGWQGHLRSEILRREVEKPLESTFFLCGPPAFMELGRGLLKDMAIAPSRVLQESFGGAVAAGTPSVPDAGQLQVTFSQSAVTFNSSPDETLLESSEKNGVLIPSGCRQGVCGTCATRLLSGNVQMEREEALNAELRSQGFVLPCVSRPRSDVTLDA